MKTSTWLTIGGAFLLAFALSSRGEKIVTEKAEERQSASARPTVDVNAATQRILQSAVNGRGKSCEKIARVSPMGVDKSGDAYIAVACSDGGTHLLEIEENDSIRYVSTCSTYEAMSGQSCF